MQLWARLDGRPGRVARARIFERCAPWLLAPVFLTAAGCKVFGPSIGARQAHPRGAPLEFPSPWQPERTADSREEAREAPALEPAEALREAPRIAGDEALSLEFRQTPLAHALHMIGELAGANLVLDAELAKTVDASFPNTTLDAALSALLEQHGLALIEDPQGIFSVRTDDGSQPAQAQFHVRSVNAADLAPKLAALVRPGSTVVIDEAQNVVFLRGTQSDVDTVEDYLGAADKLQRQVLIEALIVEVSLGERFEFGVSHEYFDGDLDGNTLSILQAFTTPDPSFSLVFETESGDLETTLQALQRYAGVEIMSSPRVLAINGTEALIEVIEEVPYTNVTSTTTGTTAGVGSTVVEEVVFKESGITLKVTPAILSGGVLRISVDQELSEVVDFFNSVPVIDARHLVSQFMVADCQTIVLGGLMQDKKNEIQRGIPFLMDLPVLGRLFRSDEEVIEKRELLVFLTPRIIDPERTADLTNAFRKRYQERVEEVGIEPLHSAE